MTFSHVENALTRRRGDGLPRTVELLNAVRNTLAKDVAPGVTEDRAKVLLQMTDLVLRHLIAREELDGAGAFEIARTSDRQATIDPALVDARLFSALAGLRNGAESAEATRSLLELIEREEAALNRLIEAENDVAPLGLDAATNARFLVTTDRLTVYLQTRVPGMAGAAVTAIQQVTGGLSKETFLFDVRQNDENFGLVLRRDIPNPPFQSSAADEFAVMKPLFERGLAVAEPIWAEHDPSFFGMPFQISRRVAGEAFSGAVEIANLPTAARKNGELLAEFLGKLHSVPIEQMPSLYQPGWLARQYVADHIEYWRDWWRTNQMEPSAIMSVAFDWLLANIPDANEPVIVHGDAGLHNLMVEDEAITAMIDWELVHIGDASEDLIYSRNWVDQVMEFDEFLAIYQANGGKTYDPAKARFYSLLTSVRNVTCTIAQYRGFRDAVAPLLPSAYSGLKWQKIFLLKAAQDLKVLLGDRD